VLRAVLDWLLQPIDRSNLSTRDDGAPSAAGWAGAMRQKTPLFGKMMSSLSLNGDLVRCATFRGVGFPRREALDLLPVRIQ
jgi:hypothetical protein